MDKLLNKEIGQDLALRWFAFIVIAMAVIVAYFPTLYFPPRGDQVVYLAEIANKQNPVDLILRTYDLNRHRIYSPGDEMLFRPLVYLFLGAEQFLFGHQFWAWQLMGIFAHLCLLWVMLRLLWVWVGPWFGFAGTWVFALSVTNYELVSWTHLTSYIFMMSFVVMAVEQVFYCFEEDEIKNSRMGRLLLYLLIACFIYESASLFTLCIVGALLIVIPKNRFKSLILMIPVVFYGLFSFYNYVYQNHLTKTGSSHGISIGKYLCSTAHVLLWWLYEGVFNGLYGYVLTIRTMFERDEVLVFKPLNFSNVEIILAFISLLAFGGLVWVKRREWFKNLKIFMLLGLMVFVYTAVIVVGRYHEMGSLKQAIRINSYYLYPFWVIMLMMAFSSLASKEKYSRIGQCLVGIFFIASITLGIVDGKKVYEMASGFSRASENTLLLVVTLDLLIQEKGQQPNFSFYVHPNYIGNSTYMDVHKRLDPLDKKYTFAELLYPQYFRPRELASFKFLDKKPHS